MLPKRGRAVHVVNAGVPGGTFGGMLGRVDLSVPQGTRLAVVQGGYNDLANGVSDDQTVADLRVLMRTSDQSCAALTDAEVSCVDVGHMMTVFAKCPQLIAARTARYCREVWCLQSLQLSGKFDTSLRSLVAKH